jgi:ABC-type amino acid transport substrate-binding protein
MSQSNVTSAARRVPLKRPWAVAMLGLATLAAWGAAGSAAALTLDQIRTQGKIRLGYQAEARPFSFKDEAGKPEGFSVTLCQIAAEEIKTKLGAPEIPIEWVPVTPEEAVGSVQSGEVDLLCGAVSVTLASRAKFSFSIPIYPGGIGAVLRVDGALALRDALEKKPDTGPFWRASPARLLSKKTFAVVKGSYAERWLAEKMSYFQIDSAILPVDSYDAGIAALEGGSADAFFGNRAVIVETAGNQMANGSLVALGRNFTNEPVAIAMPLNSDELRLAVDSALSREIQSSEFRDLYIKWFGVPDPATLQFYIFSALAE